MSRNARQFAQSSTAGRVFGIVLRGVVGIIGIRVVVPAPA